MADESAVKVCVRVRPLIQREQSGCESSESVPVYWRSDRQAIHQVDDGSITKTFNYDRVFGAEESTIQLYQDIAKPLVVSTVKGYNGTIFAYGQTSSGKTFTMMGNSRTPGVIPMAMEDVFHTIKNCPEKEFLLRVSYMEIYNETVTDLLCDSWKRKPLEIREGNYKNVYVADLTEELVRSVDQAMAWIRKGEKNRHYGKTKMNQRSSRSHTIFRMILESRERSDPASGENVDSAIIVSHLNLVDLAGAERASQTGAEGARLKEGCNINRSLFTLGQVIKKLSEENQGGFTNYRDSKLTRILQNSLGGNAKTVIICTVTPAVVDETLSTLQFASTAKRMKNDPHVTEVSDDGALLRRYRNEIVDLKRRLEEVSSVTRTAETEKEVLAQLLQEKDQLQREQEDRIRNLTNIIVTSSNFVAAEKKMPKRRVTWGGKHLRDMHLESPHFGEGEISFAEATTKKRKVDLSALADRDDEGDEFCSQWEILEEPTFDADMNQSNITTRSFDDGDYLSPLKMSELSEKVSSLELQLKKEVQEKHDALETKAALEKRVTESLEQKEALERKVAELEAATLEQKEALEKKVAELEAEVMERRVAEQASHTLKNVAELEADTLGQKEALERKLAELESDSLKEKEALEKQVYELKAESLVQKEALEKRMVELESQSQQEKEALERMVSELEAEVLEKRVTEQEAEALKKKVAELEEKALGQKETIKAMVAEQDVESLEQKETLEKRLAELEAESLVQKEALETRLAELAVQSQQEKEALERRVSELEAEVLEKRGTEQEAEALKKKVAELQDKALGQKVALETIVAEQGAESLEQKEAWERRVAELEAESLEQKKALEMRLLEVESESQGQKEALERRVAEQEAEALWQKEALEKRLVELEAEALQQNESLERRVAEVQQQLEGGAMQFVKTREDTQEQYKKDLGETIQLCETLVMEKEAVAAERDFIREQLSLLEEGNRVLQETADALRAENCTLRCEREQLLKEVEENKELEEFNALEQESTKQYESELKGEIASLQSAADHSLACVQQLEADLAAMAVELNKKEECIAGLRDLSGKDLVQQIEQLKRSLDDAEAVSRDTKKEWAILRSENLAFQERDAELTATFEKLQAEVQLVRDQQVADKDRFKKMQADLQRELQGAFEENTKLTALLDGKVPKNLIDSIKLEKQVAELKKELELSRERAGSLQGELQELTALRDLPAKVDQLMRQICDLTEDLCSAQTEKDSLETAKIARDQEVQRLEEEMQQVKNQLTDTQTRLTETELRASELSQYHVETCGQLENLQSDAERWNVERQQLLSSVEGLSQELEQKNDQQRDLEKKLAEQQQLLKDLERELAEEQASRREKENLGERSAQLQDEVKRLGEELETLQSERTELKNNLQENTQRMIQQIEELEELREERNQLRMDLQENVEMMIENQEELRNAQGKIKEQQKTMQKLEDQIGLLKSQLGDAKETCSPNFEDLEKKQQGDDLETLCAERVQLQNSLHDSVEKCAETEAQLHAVQEELERQQKVTSELTVQNAEKVSCLEQQICELTENLSSAQADKDSLEAAKSLSDQMVQRLEEEMRQVKNQLTDTQTRLTETELGTSLSQQRMETFGQLESLQSDAESWNVERQQLLSSVEGLSQELEQKNDQQRDLEKNLAEQQQLLKDLERELAEEQAARREKENLGERSAQLQDKVRKLGEELEILQDERTELQNNLQENVDKCAETRAQLHSVQEELERQQKVTSELTAQNAEKVSCLEQQVCDLHEDLQSAQTDKDSLETVKIARDQEMQRLEEDMRYVQDQLADTQARLREAECRASELIQQHMETCGQLEALQSSTDIWTAEKQQLLSSIESLSQEVEQRNNQQQELENKVAEQQQLVNDLKKELAEERTAGTEVQDLRGRSTQLEDELRKLGEELETLRAERTELQNNLQENVDKCAETRAQLHSVQEELERQQKVTSELTVQNAEKVSRLEQQICDLTEDLRSAQTDKDSLEAAKSLSDQMVQRLEEEMRQVKNQLTDTQARLTETELGTSLSQQRMETFGQLENLQSDAESWNVERQQLLSSVEGLSQELEQKNDQQRDLEKKLAEQQQLLKDLERELAEEQAARREKENLGERSAQLEDEVRKLGEELEILRDERTELQNNLQENVDKCAETRAQLHSVQEELERQQKVTSELTAQNAEKVSRLEQQVKQLSKELEQEQEKGRQLKAQLGETSAQLQSEASRRRSAAEESRHVLHRRLDETERQLLGLFERLELFSTQALQARESLTTGLEEASLLRNKLVFHVLPTMAPPSRKLYINFCKSTDDIKGLLSQTAKLYAHLAAMHRQQFESKAQCDLACVEEQRLQDLLLRMTQRQDSHGGLALLDFQDVWDQRTSELLEKREGYLQKLQSILGELEEAMARSTAIVSEELSLEQRTNEELRVLCGADTPDLVALNELLERELRQRAILAQQEKKAFQLLRDQYFHGNQRLQSFKMEVQRQLKEERGRSKALLQAADSSSVQREETQLVVQLKQAEQQVKGLQVRLRELEQTCAVAAQERESSHALLQNQLSEVQARLGEREQQVQVLQEQLKAQMKKVTAPGAAELEEIKTRLVKMEVERSAMTSSHQEEVTRLTVLLDHKEEALRKLKETLRKLQNQGDEFSSVGGAACPKASASAGGGRVLQSTAQMERAKLEGDVKHLEEEVDRLQGLVSSQKEEIAKWKSRALRLKENQRDLLNRQRPASPQHTPTKRQVAPCDTPWADGTPKKKAATPVHPKQQNSDLHASGTDVSETDDSEPECDLGAVLLQSTPRSADSGGATAGEEKASEWWPLSPNQADNCKAQ